jgi:hypothetical protein
MIQEATAESFNGEKSKVKYMIDDVNQIIDLPEPIISQAENVAEGVARCTDHPKNQKDITYLRNNIKKMRDVLNQIEGHIIEQ